MIELKLNHRLRVSHAPPEILYMLKQALTIPNPEWREGTRLPRQIQLWRKTTDGIETGRGWFQMVTSGLIRANIPYRVFDNTLIAFGGLREPISSITLRDHQRQALDLLISTRQGVYEAPTGSGKTRIGIAMADLLRHENPTVLVGRVDLAEQWKRAAAEFGVHLAVHTVQSNPDLVSTACLIVDECHHAAAPSYRALLELYDGAFLFGFSATPERAPGVFPLVEDVIGPVIARTDQTGLVDLGLLVKPKVTAVFSDLTIPWTGTQYTGMVGAMLIHPQRVKLIYEVAERAADEGHSHVLISVSRIQHLEHLAYEFGQQPISWHVYTAHGDDPKDFRLSEMKNFLANRSSKNVLITTLADEALDLPRADAIILAHPNRAEALTQQRIGRLSRVAAGKTQATVYDIVDHRMGVFLSQWRSRRKLYGENDMEVDTIYAHGGVLS